MMVMIIMITFEYDSLIVMMMIRLLMMMMDDDDDDDDDDNGGISDTDKEDEYATI